MLQIEVMKEKVRNLECPFCLEKTKNFSGLLSHITSKHSLNGECPVCDFNGRNMVIHLAKQQDEAHKLFYAIYCQVGRRRRNVREVRKELFK